MDHTLAIITVVYQNYKVLKDFIHSLESQTNENFHLYIADVSPERQPISSAKINLTVIPTDNLGYAHGVNVGLKQAIKDGHTHYAVMNDDTYFENNFVDQISLAIQKHPTTLIGGKIYYAPGFEFHKDRYNLYELGKVIWYAGGTVDWNHVITHHVGVDEIDQHQFEEEKDTEFITGCLMCFDKSVINKIGFWDPSYFLYYEDSDYCERAKKKHLKLFYVPDIVMWHKNAQSTDGSGSQLHQKYQNANRLKFGLKYAPLRTKLHLLKNYASDLISKYSKSDKLHSAPQK